MLRERPGTGLGEYRVFEHSPRFWRLAEAADRPGGLERAPLVLLSWLYSAGLSAYLSPYRVGLRKPRKIATPVVSVGNMVLGGTGKTPVVRWLCEGLLREGVKPCIVSYGYGGTACALPTVVSDGEAVHLGVAEAGDEPVMLARLLPGVPVVVGKRRFNAAHLAEQRFAPDVVILDDGFQHWQLHRNLDIVVIDARRPFGNGRTIPAGPMREPKSALRRAEVAVISHSADIGERKLQALKEEIWHLAPNMAIYEARYDGISTRDLMQGLCRSRESAVCAASSIGTPWSFEETVVVAGFSLACSVRYPDHHPYTRADVEEVMDVARRSGASAIVTTEKDAVRWPGSLNSLPVVVLDARLEVENGGELLNRVQKLLASHGA